MDDGGGFYDNYKSSGNIDMNLTMSPNMPGLTNFDNNPNYPPMPQQPPSKMSVDDPSKNYNYMGNMMN